MKYGHWDILVEDFEIEDYYGFVYFIENKTNNRRYIGKRIFKNNWEKYTGSQKHLNEDIYLTGKENFNFVIIELHKSKEELASREITLQIKNNVLAGGFYNRTIANKKFDSSGIRRQNWIKTPIQYKSYCFEDIRTEEHFIGSHIDLARKLSIQSKSVLRLINGKQSSVSGWVLSDTTDRSKVRGYHTVQHITTGEVFCGTNSEIMHKTGTTKYCLKDFLSGLQHSTRGWRLLK